MTPIDKVIARTGAGVLGIVKMIAISRTGTKEVAMAKVIQFYIPNNFRKPMKGAPEV